MSTTKTDENPQPPLAVTPGSVILAPDWHPLAHIDAFILACGWTYEPEGFVPPESWREPIALHHGGGRHWRREHAAQFCIQYHESYGWALSPNDGGEP
jgi:hypothetical protein